MPRDRRQDARTQGGAGHRDLLRGLRDGHLDHPGVPRSPAAPVLLRAATLRQIGAAGQDFVLDLGDTIELNPVLEHYLAQERGLAIDGDALEALAVAGNGFDPHPTFANLAEICDAIDGFAINPRIVVGNFSYAKLPMVADLAAQGETLPTMTSSPRWPGTPPPSRPSTVTSRCAMATRSSTRRARPSSWTPTPRSTR